MFGLLGDDDFTVKVSPDGSNYFTGFVVDNNFTAPFAGNYVFGFSLRFKANATVSTKVIATLYKNGAELGRGRASRARRAT